MEATRELTWDGAGTPLVHPEDSADRGPLFAAWEEALTLALTAAAFACVAINVEASDWVNGLPSLLPIGLSALITAYALTRVRWTQLVLLPAGLVAGATIVYLQVIAIIPGASAYIRTAALHDRMQLWWSSITQHGSTTDPLPVIVIMVTMTWVGSYIAAWAILRWRNAILGLVPGAAALIWDASFSNGEFSITATMYLVLGVLLFMRLRVQRDQARWEREDVPYPRFIALSVIHATFWATLFLLAASWVVPLGAQSTSANARWSALTGPLTSHLGPVARAFLAINPEKGAKIHGLRDQLILQGVITLRDVPAAQVQVTLPDDVAPFLRDQSFQQYRRDGWQVNAQGDTSLAPGDGSGADDGTSPLLRKDIAVDVKVAGGNGDRLFSVGQPVRSDRSGSANIGGAASDVSSVEPPSHLRNGTTYTAIGSASAATVDQLRAAGADYPSWVTDQYLQLSRRMPGRIGDKAREVSSGARNPYDAAVAIEEYLRTFPIDYAVPAAPDRQDPVDYFLFDAQRGYFDYHASAMTMMLRTLGIPARLASGFVLDESQRQGDTYKLTQQQAFAWPEVYFPGAGWVEFNPTPSQPLITRPTTPQTEVPPEPPLPAVTSNNGGVGGLSVDALPSLRGLLANLSWLASRDVLILITLFVVLASAAAAYAAWELGVRGLTLPGRAWESSIRLASLSKQGPQPHETPRAYADRLAQAVPEASDVRYIAATYERVRFGSKPMSADETRRLRSAWSSTRLALVRRILHVGRRPTRDDGPMAPE